jgi:hypothetical protein
MRRSLLVLACTILFVAALAQPALAAAPGWIVSCPPNHVLPDDPIVFPGLPGASHLHVFTGAKTTDAFSTPDSLRAGGTTCAMPDDTSAYWEPDATINGVHVLPNNTAKGDLIYYRRVAAPSGTTVHTIPDGLKLIVGNSHATSVSENPLIGQGRIFWQCLGGGTHYRSPFGFTCSGGITLSYVLPNCWDGVHLDSADHFSHMSYPVSGHCPADHPVVIPRLQAFWRYPVNSVQTWQFSSGPYYTAHMDFFSAWDAEGLQHFVDVCINALVDCGKNPTG